MRKIYYAAFAAAMAVGIVFSFTGYAQDKKTDAAATTIKIGAILPLTGKYADAGNTVKVGLELAVQDLNRKDTIQKRHYIVDYFDTGSDPKNAATAFQRMQKLGKIRYMVTTTSDHAMVLKPLAIRNDIVLFAIASHPDITKEAQLQTARYCRACSMLWL